MSYDKVQVGNRIRGSRLEKGWTQERLAAEAEISVQQLRALEKGQRNLRPLGTPVGRNGS